MKPERKKKRDTLEETRDMSSEAMGGGVDQSPRSSAIGLLAETIHTQPRSVRLRAKESVLRTLIAFFANVGLWITVAVLFQLLEGTHEKSYKCGRQSGD